MNYMLPTSNYLRRSLLVNHQRTLPVVVDQATRIQEELKSVGASHFGLWKLASRYLPHVIHSDEHIGGAVYGRSDREGAVMLLGTDRRIIFLDKKPLFVNEDEVSYRVVSGVDYSQAGLGCTIRLHTRVKDYEVHTLNKKAALKFLAYIESHLLERNSESK